MRIILFLLLVLIAEFGFAQKNNEVRKDFDAFKLLATDRMNSINNDLQSYKRKADSLMRVVRAQKDVDTILKQVPVDLSALNKRIDTVQKAVAVIPTSLLRLDRRVDSSRIGIVGVDLVLRKNTERLDRRSDSIRNSLSDTAKNIRKLVTVNDSQQMSMFVKIKSSVDSIPLRYWLGFEGAGTDKLPLLNTPPELTEAERLKELRYRLVYQTDGAKGLYEKVNGVWRKL